MLTSRQNPHALRNRLPGLGAQHGVVVVADGVGDDREGGHAGSVGHGFGGGGEAGFVGGDGVMQTA